MLAALTASAQNCPLPGMFSAEYKIKLNGFSDVAERFIASTALGPTTLQCWAVCDVVAIFTAFDDDLKRLRVSMICKHSMAKCVAAGICQGYSSVQCVQVCTPTTQRYSMFGYGGTSAAAVLDRYGPNFWLQSTGTTQRFADTSRIAEPKSQMLFGSYSILAGSDDNSQ